MNIEQKFESMEQEVRKLKAINKALRSACKKVLNMVMHPDKPYWKKKHALQFGEDCIDILNIAISKAKGSRHESQR